MARQRLLLLVLLWNLKMLKTRSLPHSKIMDELGVSLIDYIVLRVFNIFLLIIQLFFVCSDRGRLVAPLQSWLLLSHWKVHHSLLLLRRVHHHVCLL